MAQDPRKRVLMSRKFIYLFLALLALGLAVSYANCFGIGFYFDDTYGISANPAIRSLRNIPSFFVDPHAVWTEPTQVDLRPILLISYAVNYAISGLQPWSYHVLNLILHFIASVVVFITVRDHVWWPASERGSAGAARIPAAAAALFFALAPLNSQPVDYLWARSALLCVTLYLGAFLAFLRRRWTLGSVLFALALLTKAIAVTLPAVFLIHDFIYRDRSRYPTIKTYLGGGRRLIVPLVLLGLMDAAYIGYRNYFLPDWTAAARMASGVTPWVWFMSQWSALLYYVRLFLWPDGLSADHDFPMTTSLLATRAWGSLALLLLWAAFALKAARRHPQVTFATAWFFVTLAPESSFAPLAEVINDHRPYIASALGLSVLLAWIIDRAAALITAQRQRQLAFIAASLILCAVALPLNRYRTWQWSDSLRIWEDTTYKSPNNGRAWMNTGLAYMSRGDLISARRHFERAREINPQYAFVHMNLSILEASEGHPDKALSEAQEAVRLRPDLSLTHFYLGQALEKMNWTNEAVAAYQRAIQLDPRYTEAKVYLARLKKFDPEGESALMSAGLYALYTRGDPTGAIVQFGKVLEINPNHYGATFQLAMALVQAGKSTEARSLWEKVLAMAQASKDNDTANTARARLAKPNVASAEFSQEEAMKKGLDLLYTRNDPNTAAFQFRNILERNPNHYGATFQLAMALDRAGKSREARPLWEKMFKMAEASNDKETLAMARARLEKRP
jgi:tetratricopeptide (TPR) repeat protein